MFKFKLREYRLAFKVMLTFLGLDYRDNMLKVLNRVILELTVQKSR